MPAAMVNSLVNTKLFSAIKYNSGLTEIVKQVFAQTGGSWLTREWVKWIDNAKNLSSAFYSVVQQAATAIKDLVWNNAIMQAFKGILSGAVSGL